MREISRTNNRPQQLVEYSTRRQADRTRREESNHVDCVGDVVGFILTVSRHYDRNRGRARREGSRARSRVNDSAFSLRPFRPQADPPFEGLDSSKIGSDRGPPRRGVKSLNCPRRSRGKGLICGLTWVTLTSAPLPSAKVGEPFQREQILLFGSRETTERLATVSR